MAELKTHLDVYKILPKTNCKACGLATCLAFSAMVIQGTKKLSDCPKLGEEILSQNKIKESDRPDLEQAAEEQLASLCIEIKQMDLSAAAERLGARFVDDKLFVSMLSKDFSVDRHGTIFSGCHVNGWVAVPLLHYVLNCQGVEPKGEWVALRELKGGLDWERFFNHQCEKNMATLVDNHTDFFEDLIDVFNAAPARDFFDSDIAVILHPLPKLPVLICYWKPEDGMDSSLHMFFDRNADKNLDVEHIYSICFGMVTMFKKIVLTHVQ